jgi:hypothetical protein
MGKNQNMPLNMAFISILSSLYEQKKVAGQFQDGPFFKGL